MDISNIVSAPVTMATHYWQTASVSAPVTMATDCWQTACQNKKKIAAIIVSTAAIAAVASCISNKIDLLSMHDRIFEVAKNPSDKIYKSLVTPGPVVGLDTCPSSFKKYEISIQFPVGEVPSAKQLDRIEALYNKATSNGEDIFSTFGYSAGKVSNSNPIVQSLDTETYRFVICRQSFSDKFFGNNI